MSTPNDPTLGFVQQKEDYIRKIDAVIITMLKQHQTSRFYQPLLQAMHGGKRLRPLLLLLIADMLNHYATSDPMPAAVAVEFIHLESLIHDDILDHDLIRRAAPAFHIRHDLETAILSADFLLSLILNVVSHYDDARITSILSDATGKMCEGELEELKTVHSKKPLQQEEYLKLVTQKTAVLFEAAARIGALLGDAKKPELEVITRYGRYVGIAYQIYDDITDASTPILHLLQSPSGNPLSSNQQFLYLRNLADSYLALANQEATLLTSRDSSNLQAYTRLIQSQFHMKLL